MVDTTQLYASFRCCRVGGVCQVFFRSVFQLSGGQPVVHVCEVAVFLSTGYVFITNIPAGASDIQIIEKRKTESILGENLQLL